MEIILQIILYLFIVVCLLWLIQRIKFIKKLIKDKLPGMILYHIPVFLINAIILWVPACIWILAKIILPPENSFYNLILDIGL